MAIATTDHDTWVKPGVVNADLKPLLDAFDVVHAEQVMVEGVLRARSEELACIRQRMMQLTEEEATLSGPEGIINRRCLLRARMAVLYSEVCRIKEELLRARAQMDDIHTRGNRLRDEAVKLLAA